MTCPASKDKCKEMNPSHYHVNTRKENPHAIGSTLWAYAGDASIEEALATDGPLANQVKSTAKFLRSQDNDGGLRLIDEEGEELEMEDYILYFLEEEIDRLQEKGDV